MTEIQNIHDKYFKDVFSRKDVALDMLRMLNKKVLRKLDLRTFRLSNASFVDENLKESFADLIYNCRTKRGEKVKVSFIFEHKSYLETYPHLQLLQYFLNAWNENKKQKEPLTTLIPVIIYHGQKHWEKLSFASFFSSLENEYLQFIPNFNYLLWDLSAFSNDEIEHFENKFLAMSSLIMKNVQREKYYQEIIESFINLFEKLENDDNFVKTTFLYLTKTNTIEREELLLYFQKTTIKLKNRMLSVYDQLIQEGISQGISQGFTQGISQGISQGILQSYTNVVKNFYKKGYSKSQIVEQFNLVFDLPKSKATKIIDEILSTNKIVIV